MCLILIKRQFNSIIKDGLNEKYCENCRSYGVVRGNYEVATEEERAYTIKVAEKLTAKLDEEGFPTLVRPILPSHVAGCFWLVF